jgi:high affinity Mn2+ porin
MQRILPEGRNKRARVALGAACAAMVATSASNAFADDIIVTKAPPIPYTANTGGYNWTGFYGGANLGVAWGQSNWSAAGAPPSTGTNILYQSIDTFSEAGSFYVGVQAGYNYLLPNRVLLGAEADFSAPSFTSPTSGLSVGGSSPNFNSAALGAVNFSETQLATGTIRGRVGYAPGNWLFYATGGFAMTYNQQSLTQVATGNSDSPFIWRFGWTAGGGVETPVAPHWTARIEYLFTDYGNKSWPFFGGAQPLTSNFEIQEVRAGLNYQFNNGSAVPSLPLVTKASPAPDADTLDFHGQTTFVYQGTPAFRAPIGSTGPNSLQPVANARETFDTTLFVGIRPWQNAEIWVDPEIDQGHGLADTHGVAGFPSGESYKQGADYPYGRVNRYFLRQTIDLGGDKQKLEDDINQFEQTVTSNRLVITVGKFAIVDIFDTNKYANNPKADFLNWSMINAGTFDYAGDAWGFTYGGAAEWYQGIFTFRAGVFDMSATPAMAANSVTAYGLDETFSQQQFIGEIEERHELFGEPGKFKITAFVTHGRMGSFADALAMAANPADPNFGNPSGAIAADRVYRLKPGVSGNLEQQVNDWIGVFARAGWSDGRYENWDFTDIDETVQAGVSLNGKQWGRANDTVGVAGIINGIQSVHQAYFAAGGTGVLIGDGSLPSYGTEQIIETYYSYGITEATKVSFDYQFIANPGYNATRGPVSVFAGRFHTQF